MMTAKMESWLLYALLAMLFYGLYNALMKVVVDPKLGGMNPITAALVISVAVFVSTLAYGIYTNNIINPFSKTSVLAVMSIAGIVFAAGTVATAIALQKGNASQVIPIMNANMLVAVIIAMIFLGEAAKANVAKVIAGVVLIMAGVFFLS